MIHRKASHIGIMGFKNVLKTVIWFLVCRVQGCHRWNPGTFFPLDSEPVEGLVRAGGGRQVGFEVEMGLSAPVVLLSTSKK